MLNRFRVYKISKVNDAEISDIGPTRIETFWLRVSLLANVFTKSITAYLLLILRRGPRFILKFRKLSEQSFGPKYLESRQNNGWDWSLLLAEGSVYSVNPQSLSWQSGSE